MKKQIALVFTFLFFIAFQHLNAQENKNSTRTKTQSVSSSTTTSNSNIVNDKSTPPRNVPSTISYDYSCMDDGTGQKDVNDLFELFYDGALGALGGEVTDADQSAFGEQLYDQMVDEGYTFITRGNDYQLIQTVMNELLPYRKNPSGITYHIHLIDSDEINAFTAGGHIFVYTGILDYIETQSELAVVIGHEIGHNEMGHIKDMMTELQLARDFAGDFGDMGVALRQMVNPSFGQKNEVEVDFYGSDLAYAAGYKACKGADFWARMAMDEGDGDPIENWLRSHPYSTVRRDCLINHLDSNYGASCN